MDYILYLTDQYEVNMTWVLCYEKVETKQR